MHRIFVILAAALTLALSLPLAAHAHLGNVGATVDMAPAADLTPRLDLATTAFRAGESAASPLILMLGLLAGLGLALASRCQPRRALVVILAVLVAMLAVESGIHSVHHLGDRTVTACSIAAAAGHLTLCLNGGPLVVSPWLISVGAIADDDLAPPAAPGLGRDLARAPPAPIA